MRAGRLRHRVTFQEKTLTQNEYGEAIETWADMATVWASVSPRGGREALTQAEETQTLRVDIRARSRDDVTPEMRATWNGHTYDIEQVVRFDEAGRDMLAVGVEVL